MEFTLENLIAYIAQSAIPLYTDFTTDNFWSSFQKVAVFKVTYWPKKSMV